MQTRRGARRRLPGCCRSGTARHRSGASCRAGRAGACSMRRQHRHVVAALEEPCETGRSAGRERLEGPPDCGRCFCCRLLHLAPGSRAFGTFCARAFASPCGAPRNDGLREEAEQKRSFIGLLRDTKRSRASVRSRRARWRARFASGRCSRDGSDWSMSSLRASRATGDALSLRPAQLSTGMGAPIGAPPPNCPRTSRYRPGGPP